MSTTTVTAEPATAESASSASAPPRRRRAWLRVVIPLAVVTLFWAVSVAAHVYQEPLRRNPDTLSPFGTGRHGSSQLAELLRERNVTIERVGSTTAAIAAARGRDATILVTAPDLMDGRLVGALVDDPGEHRVVMVQPGPLGVYTSGLAVALVGSRWASKIVEPACAVEDARQAGAARVYRNRYEGERLTTRCYGGSVIGGQVRDVEVLLVGATDPFRNDRIGEAGNAALATGLLDRHGLVIWADVHASELRVSVAPPEYVRHDWDRSSTGYPLLDAFPVQFWTAIVLLVAAGVLLAVAQARRLGPPVPEPLPVVVPAAEAVTGRGRLYRRIGARQSSLMTLRAAALVRLARVVDPLARAPERGLATPGPQRDVFVRAICDRTGLPESTVVTVLFGPVPTDDAGLVAAADRLDRLVAAVLAPARPRSDTPDAQTRPPEPGGSP